MQTELLTRLRERRARIHIQWEALLRAEPIVTPLGHPDALVHLIDWSLDEIFSALANPLPPQLEDWSARASPCPCPCGRNPLLAYFQAGRQAVQEAMVLAQAAAAPLDPTERDSSMRELMQVVQQLAQREMEAFCGVCQFRETALTSALAPERSLAHAG